MQRHDAGVLEGASGHRCRRVHTYGVAGGEGVPSARGYGEHRTTGRENARGKAVNTHLEHS